ncbi:hypothetical protein [Legionella hackeliae]|uniref:Uncharacterized protein n=1 Tax=Legionella hackeliae TaxID=449 RepID=A0A0A8URV5_LEGHA|nr:hypothetical protein [Legionella hackeliae]KTD15169.1 hypothetical protein Lhac_0011 [Legionella hackeliae]CEK11468.1 membrane protein of unknown function [Legionella hackeliae]STX48238.1 Uncharacterised protein [Legionella hackeliae]
MNDLIDDLFCFEVYLKGGDTRELKKHLQYYDNRLDELKYNYRQVIINSEPKVETQIKTLLEVLNIPPEKRKDYLNLTVYNLLIKLNQESHPQIAYILKLLDEKKAISKLKFFLGTLVAASAFTILLIIFPSFYNFFWTMEALLTSVTGLPILGLTYTLADTFYQFYKTQTNVKSRLLNRLQDNFFLLCSTLINIAAYSVWIVVAAPMTVLVASLFVLASVVNVLKEAASLVQEYRRFRNLPPIHDSNPLLIHQAYIRQIYGFNKHRNILFINLATSVLLVGVMAGWCFIPGGLVVTLGALAGIGMIYGLQYWALKVNEASIRNNLQTQLKTKEREYERTHPNTELKDEVSLALSQLASQVEQPQIVDTTILELPPSLVPQQNLETIITIDAQPSPTPQINVTPGL